MFTAQPLHITNGEICLKIDEMIATRAEPDGFIDFMLNTMNDSWGDYTGDISLAEMRAFFNSRIAHYGGKGA